MSASEVFPGKAFTPVTASVIGARRIRVEFVIGARRIRVEFASQT